MRTICSCRPLWRNVRNFAGSLAWRMSTGPCGRSTKKGCGAGPFDRPARFRKAICASWFFVAGPRGNPPRPPPAAPGGAGFSPTRFPFPEVEKQHGMGSASADTYLASLAPLFGTTKRLAEARGCYRIHGKNDYVTTTFDERLRRDLLTYECQTAALVRYCKKMEIDVD